MRMHIENRGGPVSLTPWPPQSAACKACIGCRLLVSWCQDSVSIAGPPACSCWSCCNSKNDAAYQEGILHGRRSIAASGHRQACKGCCCCGLLSYQTIPQSQCRGADGGLQHMTMSVAWYGSFMVFIDFSKFSNRLKPGAHSSLLMCPQQKHGY